MKKKSIKAHLKPYSIYHKRKTTINHAFASAIAPDEKYDDRKLDAALRLLGQDPDSDLRCVYCDELATTWDHLVGLVEKSELRGYGHQIGNLLPCCRACNSSKGGQCWTVFLKKTTLDPSKLEVKYKSITSYVEKYAVLINLTKAAETDDWKRYHSIKSQILELMGEADKVAERLRRILAEKD